MQRSNKVLIVREGATADLDNLIERLQASEKLNVVFVTTKRNGFNRLIDSSVCEFDEVFINGIAHSMSEALKALSPMRLAA